MGKMAQYPPFTKGRKGVGRKQRGSAYLLKHSASNPAPWLLQCALQLVEAPTGRPTDTQRPYNGHFRCSGASMHQGLSKPRGCRNHPTAIWPLSRPPRPNRTWRPRQGGPNGQKPALYPVSGLIPVRTCHGPKCPPAQPPSGASGPLAAAILKRGLERPRRRAGSPTWGRARAGGLPRWCQRAGSAAVCATRGAGGAGEK